MSTTTHAKKRSTKTGEQELADSRGMSKFVMKTYKWTGLGIAGSLGTALSLDLVGVAGHHPFACFGIGFATGMLSVFGILKGEYKKHTVGRYHYTTNSDLRKLSFGGLVTGIGTTMAPLVEMCNEISPTICRFIPVRNGRSKSGGLQVAK